MASRRLTPDALGHLAAPNCCESTDRLLCLQLVAQTPVQSMSLTSQHIISAKMGWAIGTTLAVSAQFVGNLGTVLQRRSHIDDASHQPLLRRPLWLFGLFLIALASISDFAALNFTSKWMDALLWLRRWDLLVNRHRNATGFGVFAAASRPRLADQGA